MYILGEMNRLWKKRVADSIRTLSLESRERHMRDGLS